MQSRIVISDINLTMAVFSAIKNKKNQKLREGIEDLVAKCGDDTECGHVDVRSPFLYNS